MKKIFFVAPLFLLIAACHQKPKADSATLTGANLLHSNVNKLTEVIINDVFSPPVSSRIYNYTAIAAYEAVRFQKEGSPSYAAALNGFPAMPQPEAGKPYNYLLAATKAFFTVAKKVTFTVAMYQPYEDSVYKQFAGVLDEATYNNSVQFGE